MKKNKNHRKIWYAEYGIYPLLSRNAFPFGLDPQSKNGGVIRFVDWGYNQSIFPVFIGILAVLTVIIVGKFGHGGWGQSGYPVGKAYLLLGVGIPMLLYGVLTLLLSQSVCIDPVNKQVVYKTAICNIVCIRKRATNLNSIELDISPATIAFTRTGRFKTKAHGVLLCPQNIEMPCKLIACYRSRESASDYALAIQQQLAEADVIVDLVNGEEFEGRLSR